MVYMICPNLWITGETGWAASESTRRHYCTMGYPDSIGVSPPTHQQAVPVAGPVEECRRRWSCFVNHRNGMGRNSLPLSPMLVGAMGRHPRLAQMIRVLNLGPCFSSRSFGFVKRLLSAAIRVDELLIAWND